MLLQGQELREKSTTPIPKPKVSLGGLWPSTPPAANPHGNPQPLNLPCSRSAARWRATPV